MTAIFSKKTTLATLTIATMAVVALQPAHAQAKSKFGVTVDECVHWDMDEYDQNFCSDKLMQSYAKIAKSTPANFDGNKVLHIFKGKGGDRIVVIDKTTKKVYTEQGAFQTLTSPYANVKSEKKQKYTFNRNSNKMCFEGEYMAYREATDSESEGKPLCFSFVKDASSSTPIYSLEKDFF